MIPCRQNASLIVRQEKHARRYDGAAGPINCLVDELAESKTDSSIPYTDPDYGGSASEVLLLLSDPGPMTQAVNAGSGMISFQNDDPGAERICRLTQVVGLDPGRCISWNAYPWYINKPPSAAQMDEGLMPLRQLLELLPDLQVVVAMGGTAQKQWNRFRKRYPAMSERWIVIETLHSANRGVTRGGRQTAEEGESELRAAFAAALEPLPVRPTSAGMKEPEEGTSSRPLLMGEETAQLSVPEVNTEKRDIVPTPSQERPQPNRSDERPNQDSGRFVSSLGDRVKQASLRAVNSAREAATVLRGRLPASGLRETAGRRLRDPRRRPESQPVDPMTGRQPRQDRRPGQQVSPDELETCPSCGAPAINCRC